MNNSLSKPTTMRRLSFFSPYDMVPYVFSDFAKEVDGLGTIAIVVLPVEEDIVNMVYVNYRVAHLCHFFLQENI